MESGRFLGNVNVSGTLVAAGKGFRIDHPKFPRTRFLNHSSVESPDMLTVYSGYVVTGQDSLAEIQLPDYFESLNADFKYQLTPVGQWRKSP